MVASGFAAAACSHLSGQEGRWRLGRKFPRTESSRIIPSATHSFLLDPVSQTSQGLRAQTHESMRDTHQTITILVNNTTSDMDKKIRKKKRFPKVQSESCARLLISVPIQMVLCADLTHPVCGSLCFSVMSLIQALTPEHPFSS